MVGYLELIWIYYYGQISSQIGSKSAFRKIMIDISPAMEGRDGESMAYLYFASYCMALASMFVSLL